MRSEVDPRDPQNHRKKTEFRKSPPPPPYWLEPRGACGWNNHTRVAFDPGKWGRFGQGQCDEGGRCRSLTATGNTSDPFGPREEPRERGGGDSSGPHSWGPTSGSIRSCSSGKVLLVKDNSCSPDWTLSFHDHEKTIKTRCPLIERPFRDLKFLRYQGMTPTLTSSPATSRMRRTRQFFKSLLIR